MSKSARLLFISVYLLIGLGVVMTYSSSAVYAEHVYKNPQFFLFRQIIYVVIGTIAMLVVASVPVSFWRTNARVLMLLTILLLLTIFVPAIGHSAGGAKRWLRVAGFQFQPSEFAKLVICIYLSDYLSRKMKYIKQGGALVFFPPLLLIGIICGLIILQPDLGSCAFIVLMASILFFLAGIRLRYVFIAISAFIPIFYFLVIRVPYRLNRVTAYLNPWDDPQGSGFQMIQSILAYGLGGLHGVGLGQSTQKLFYLPSGYNDFIFSVIAEELGLVGVSVVLILFGTIFVCGLRMSRRASNIYERLFTISLTLFMVLQALINMMVATGLLPTKGLALPFISYGGTSVVVNLICVGLLLGLDLLYRDRKY